MRDLTRGEIEEYLRFAKADKAASNFNSDQVVLIGEAFTASGLFGEINKKIAWAPDDVTAEDIALSLYVMAFQMGRECESRLITAALKGSLPVHDRLRHRQH